ncbi:ATP-dependent DNA helicase Q-like 5 isoform X3 [Rhodamnia argentea]|uniref:DNA 3'-5' helicase n=1 Tax=Rhodamnia argentea TaxID=178133 RepID=A0ABM3HH33_9MYRT|nr:ATP-dependent DNA helicase Q-like 5 isoform X3 [Rhodamnia argentea]
MDSDSDSDGSHVSATPPRDHIPPPPPPPPLKPRARPTSSSRSSARTPAPKPQSHRLPNPSNLPSQDLTAMSIPSPLSTAPFHVRRPLDPPETVATIDSFQILPAGHFSKSASFSKLQRPSLNFENEESDLARSKSELKSETVERDGSAVKSTSSVKAARKNLNLIRANVALPPTKLRKSGGEGNFVRLNMNHNSYRRKFLSKSARKNSRSSGFKRFPKRRKGKFGAEIEAQMEGVFEEEGLVTESTKQKIMQESESRKFDSELVEAALSAVRNDASDVNLVKLLKLVYGYDLFRDRQLEAIRMVLAGKSTMLVLPTGAGKSLCYQIPSMILPGMTLVVSPLVALMIDQLKQLPPMINGGLLCSSQTWQETSETLRLLQEGSIKVLFVSPERFLNEDFMGIFSTDQLVSLVVIDEAHCLSEWSHNFRPSYTRLRASLFHVRLRVNCILAMTATATSTTLDAVMGALEIPSSNLIQKVPLRDNLQLFISMSHNRMKDLLMLLRSSPYSEVQSIIVYCKFQSETDLISRYLRDNNISAKSYHSGIPTKDRARIQELFCSNKIRVIVATVAFGMGLDKRDIGAIMHYSLPNSLEEYVQEIGRAGRDGRLSYCHLFYDDMTYFKLRSLAHSDGVDEYAVDKFLCQVFNNGTTSHGQVCSIMKESASRRFDMKEEVMLTILTHLELGEVQYLQLLPQLNVTCTLNFHQTQPVLLSDKDIVVAAILKKSEARQGQYVFDIPTVANSIGVTAAELTNHLQNLKLKGEITYETKDSAYCYVVVDVPEDICSLSANVTKWLSDIESCKVHKLDAMNGAAVFALNTCERTNGCSGTQHTWCLQRKIMDYFDKDYHCDIPSKMTQSSSFLRADIKVFLQSNSQAKFTPRAVARILHGISSPAYPSMIWGRTHFWNMLMSRSFNSQNQGKIYEGGFPSCDGSSKGRTYELCRKRHCLVIYR